MSDRDIVVVGASAGGVEALTALVAGLPPDFPGAVLVVLHVPAAGTSALPRILGRAGALPVRHAAEGDPIEGGTVLVAPPDQHMIVFDHAITLSRGPKENGHRPAVDVLFRSAAKTFGSRVIGVVLSGALDDGTAGMVAVKLRGGIGIVQDPDDALHANMPRSAMTVAGVDHVLPVTKIAALLGTLIRQEAPDGQGSPSTLMEMEAAMADLDREALSDPDRPGAPSGLSCPDCHGSLFEIAEGGLVRFRCRVGHAWSPGSLVAQQSASLESALWIALRSLEEKVALARELASRAAHQGHRLSSEGFSGQAEEAQQAAGLLRDLIREVGGVVAMAEGPRDEGGD